jgi:hypothetical protein
LSLWKWAGDAATVETSRVAEIASSRTRDRRNERPLNI